MASEEIGEINSCNHKLCSGRSCIIQVDYDRTMNKEDLLDVGKVRIFRVPKSLRDSHHFYSPKLVSIGPFHYGKEELKGMEKSKSEAVRRMEERIQKNGQDTTIELFFENMILLKCKEIREFYGEHIPFPDKKLASMVVRDACFVFEFLANYVGSSGIGEPFHNREVSAYSWNYDAVFDVSYQNPMREGLMDDILLYENQIPLWVLKDILQIQTGSLETAKNKLDELMRLLHARAVRHNVFMWYTPYDYHTSSHVLEVVYHGMLDRYVSDYAHGEALQLPPSRNRMQICFEKGVDSMEGISGRWCKLCLPSHSSNTSADEGVKLGLLKLPTASELARQGVKIHAVFPQGRPINKGSAIEWIRFDEKTSTLYLPQMNVTVQSHSVMRNIIAMEVSIAKRYSPRPFTQFAIFMDELIDSEEDVALLRDAKAINNFLGSNQQVAELFHSLANGITSHEGCKVIVDARKGLFRYTRRKSEILLSEFVSAYFSKPWLVTASMAAALLLLIIMAQVFR